MTAKTVLETLAEAVRASVAYNPGVQARPGAILWPDASGQWQSAVPMLLAHLPELVSLGEYNPISRTGPAIWLKCAIARVVPDSTVPVERTPVVYLPGVGRPSLRAIESCPRNLQPLAELQYRGVFWSQANAKDWTVNAFLCSSHGGLGLNIAQDPTTQEALLRAFNAGELLACKVDDLRGRLLDAEFFDSLIAQDQKRDLLVWMNDSPGAKQSWAKGRWDVFAKRCRQDYGFHPVQDGELTAAEKLAGQSDPWAAVWELYSDSHSRYPNILPLLQRVHPGTLLDNPEGYPSENDKAEAQLREALLALASLPAADARAKVLKLEAENGGRREWLWARMGRAPLAVALQHLAKVATLANQPLGGASIEDMTDRYRTSGWGVDMAALDALAAATKKADANAVEAALRACYVPWLEQTALRFQELVRHAGGLSGPSVREPAADEYVASQCVMFVDGLRYDVAQRLAQRLNELGMRVTTGSAWTTIPSVTASGKSWVTPVASFLRGVADDTEFEPRIKVDGRAGSTANLRKVMSDAGWQVLDRHTAGDPSGKAWTECGDLDHYGHEHGLQLARELDHQFSAIAERVQELLAAGWRKVRIVTDHGWLLVPGGMPKAELAKSATETRWGRCAILKQQAASAALSLPWDWCAEVRVALAPGISSFVAGNVYDHGGLSLQESLVPIIDIVPDFALAPPLSVQIRSITWQGLRCRIEAETAVAGLCVDLRTKPGVAESSVLGQSKALDRGKASFVVENDDLEGTVAVVVVLDDHGRVMQKQTTTIGGE